MKLDSKLVSTLLFIGGAAIGSVVTWQLVKETYRKMAEEEIASVKEYYKGRYSEPQPSEPTKSDTEVPVRAHRHDMTPEEKETVYRYSELTRSYVPTDEEQDVEYVTDPYVIAPELFGECEGYETKSLTYYADGILADDKGNIVDDADDVVGTDFKDHFGDFEDDAVHIRSEWAQCDFEIIAVETRYSDIKPRNPRQMEVKWDDMK